MKRHLFFGLTFLLAGGLMMTSCNLDQFDLSRLSDEVEFEPQLVAPLVYGSIPMKDIVARFDSAGYVDEFEDGLIYLVYSDTLVEVMADTIAELPDQVYQEIYYDPEIGDDPIYILSGVGDTVHFYKSSSLRFTLQGDDRIDSILFKGGRLKMDVASSFRHTGYVNISSGQIIDPQGNSLMQNIPISDLSGSFEDSVVIDASGFRIVPLLSGDTSVIQIDYDFAVINSGNPVEDGDTCRIRTSLLNMDYSGAYGYIDSRDLISESGDIEIPIFEDNPDFKTLKLQDPRIRIATASSIGIPVEIEMDSVIATSGEGATETLVFHSGHPFQIPAPVLANAGETVYGEILINKETSNFPDLLNLAPSHISYRVAGRTQPGTEDQNHFILDTSRFMLEAEVLVPLDFRITGYALSDTLEFGGTEDGIDTGPVEQVEVSVSTVNELPLHLGLQIYMMDEFHTVLDSVFEGEAVLIEASVVDADGKLIQASEETNTVELPAEKLDILGDVNYLQVEAFLITSDGGQRFVKIYSDYSLDFDISVSGIFRINTNEL